eukprot:1380752-Prymnesium_polylepis.1
MLPGKHPRNVPISACSCDVARDVRAPRARGDFDFLRFMCMLGTDGACFRVPHALRYHPMPLSCVWRAVPENRVFRSPPLKRWGSRLNTSPS